LPMVFKIVLLRHGESEWNVANIFTGWADVDLSANGVAEAKEAGKCLKAQGFKFDVVYTSVLRRSIKTAWVALMHSENYSMPIINTWRLNERHYGGLQGLNKAETAAKHGEEQVKIWRRSYDVPPPSVDCSDPRHPATDPLYAGVPEAALPGAESLAMTVDRVLPCWHDCIGPAVKGGLQVLIVAHGNSLRALCKYLEDMSNEEVLDLNIPTSVPLVYELDERLDFVRKYYLMDPDEVAQKMKAVALQGSVQQGSAPAGITPRQMQQQYALDMNLEPPMERFKYLLVPQLARGTCFTKQERRSLGLEGLLPPVVEEMDRRAGRWEAMLEEEPDRLKKYYILMQLHALDVTLFYQVLVKNLVELMPVVYTPTVGQACLEFDKLKRTHNGMYITYFGHRGRIRQILDNWPFEVDIIVVTDGGRILGLGDLGTNGMGIPIGKIALYVAGGGFNPTRVLPVQLDCGTDREEYWTSDFYLGAKKPRISYEEHAAFLEEFNEAVKEKWPKCLIQFEDFATDRAFSVLEAARRKCLCFNDDIQGTGSVVLAGFINGMKAQGTGLKDAKVVFFGAGSAACGVAIQLAGLLVSEGLSLEEARSQIYMFDQRGLLTTTRGDELPDYSRDFARSDGTPDMASLLEVINYVRPHALFGLSGAGPLFTQDIIEAMCASIERPLIFPLSNPTAKAEVTAENAYRWSDGKCIFAAGSPFAPVEYNGKTYVPGQGNNVFIFPGVGFGAWAVGSTQVLDEFFLEAAKELASYVSEEELAEGRIYPSIAKLREVSRNVAARTAECAYAMGLATLEPKPGNMRDFIEQQMYEPAYGEIDYVTPRKKAPDEPPTLDEKMSRAMGA